jgi:hypothetical protein
MALRGVLDSRSGFAPLMVQNSSFVKDEHSGLHDFRKNSISFHDWNPVSISSPLSLVVRRRKPPSLSSRGGWLRTSSINGT